MEKQYNFSFFFTSIVIFVPSTQKLANFKRVVYASYCAVSIALSFLWEWQVDKIAPDRNYLVHRSRY
ncbi:hypothetical protein H6G17_29475 [Chroococcidiopsis sp. FACHB-1243]|nr:hypothetical protein [Chroococcidiopsis sp. [FACHB-1243]]